MSYIARNGKVWSLPFGAEHLGETADGVPLYWTGTGVAEAKPVKPRQIRRGQ